MSTLHCLLVFLACCLYQANAVILSGKCHDDPIISTFDANQVKIYYIRILERNTEVIFCFFGLKKVLWSMVHNTAWWLLLGIGHDLYTRQIWRLQRHRLSNNQQWLDEVIIRFEPPKKTPPLLKYLFLKAHREIFEHRWLCQSDQGHRAK